MLIKTIFLIIFSLVSLQALGSDSLDEAYESYLRGDYSGSIYEALDKNVKPQESDRSFYLLGMSYLKLGDYSTARNYFRKIIKKYPGSKHYYSSLIKLGDAYFLENDFKKALSAYTHALKKHSRISFEPLIYLRLAQIYAKQGEWDKEKKYIRKIKSEFPQSVEMDYARILENRGYFFTVQVGAFSQRANAQGVVKDLKPEYPAYMVKEKAGDLVLYKVRVGKFKDKKPAQDVYDALVDQGYPARIYP